MRAYVYSDLSEAEMFHVQPAVSCHVCYVVQLLLDCLRASDCSFACVLVCVCVCVCLFVCLFVVNNRCCVAFVVDLLLGHTSLTASLAGL